MSMKKLLAAWTMALTLVGGSMTSVWAGDGVPVRGPSSEVDISAGVGCGAMVCLDVYHVKCGGPTRYLYGLIVDNDSSGDNVVLTLNALVPGPIKGTAVGATTPAAGPGFAASTVLLRQGSSSGAMQAYATVGNATDIFVAYFLTLQCNDINGFPTPTTVTQKQNQ